MATVTVYTAEHMLEIENASIVSGEIVGTHLVLTTRGGEDIDAGVVKGDTGDTGPTGPAASFAGYKEPILDLGSVSGSVTLDFDVSNNWKINPTGAITIVFDNLPPTDFVAGGVLIIENSTYAITWPVGTQFPLNTAPILSGKTVLSLIAEETEVMVSSAWAEVA